MKLLPFIQGEVATYDLRDKLRKIHGFLTYLTEKFRCISLSREAKIDVILTGWDKLFGILTNEAIIKNDKNLKNILLKIVVVRESVKKVCIAKYIQQCRYLYFVALL